LSDILVKVRTSKVASAVERAVMLFGGAPSAYLVSISLFLSLALVACGGSPASKPSSSTAVDGSLEAGEGSMPVSEGGEGPVEASVPEALAAMDGTMPDRGTESSVPDSSLDASSSATVADSAPDAASTPGGSFVAVGYGGRRIRSIDDGKTWLDDQSLEPDGGGDDQDLLRTIAFGDGVFLAAGWQTLTSSDGKTWGPVVNPHDNWFGALTYASSMWVAVGGYGMRLTSPDGVTWTNHSIASHPHGCLVVATAPITAFVACNDMGQRSYAPDGATWKYSTGATDVMSSQVTFGNGVVVGTDGTTMVLSRDAGSTWTKGSTLDVAGGGMMFAQGHFTILATDFVYTSNDGSTWTKNPAKGIRPGVLAFGDGTYVAIVNGHQFQRSSNGITWDAPVDDTSKINSLEWVAFGPTK
jgi:hypothetical protein